MTQRQIRQDGDHLEPRRNRHEQRFYLLYPDTYWATESQIRGWLADAIANGDVDEAPFDVTTVPIEYVIMVLQDTGKFTFQEYRDEN